MFGSGTIDIRKYRIKRVVKFGKRRKSALTELLLFCANAPDNFLEREIGMKIKVSGGIHFLPWLPNKEKVSTYRVI